MCKSRPMNIFNSGTDRSFKRFIRDAGSVFGPQQTDKAYALVNLHIFSRNMLSINNKNQSIGLFCPVTGPRSPVFPVNGMFLKPNVLLDQVGESSLSDSLSLLLAPVIDESECDESLSISESTPTSP